MEKYLFFNSSGGDVRQYQASDFAWYFDNILKSGLIHTDGVPELNVMCDGTDLRTYIVPGKAIIQGHAYENTSDLYLEHGLPEASLDRIDRIVLRLDKRNQSRWIRAFVKQGEPGSNPVAPSLQKDEFIHELSLAQIRVRANTSALNPADLADERLDESLCGLVSIQDTGFVPWGEYNNMVSQKADSDEVIPLSQKGQTNGVATLDSSGDVPASQLGHALTNKSDVFVTGKYSGNGDFIEGQVYTKTINLGFVPSAVLVMRTGGGRNNYTNSDVDLIYGGFVTYGNPMRNGSDSVLEIVSNGFVVGNIKTTQINSQSYGYQLNDDGMVYIYIAFK